MRGPLLTTVYRCVVSRSVYPMKGFTKTKASSFLAKDLFKGQVHGQIPPVRGCTCRQILLSEKVPSVMLLSPRPMHGYGKQGEWVWYPPMLKRGWFVTGMSVFYFDLRGRTRLPVSQNSPTSVEVLFILIDSSEKRFIWGRNNMMCHCVYISVFKRAYLVPSILFYSW